MENKNIIEAVKAKRGYEDMYCIIHYPGWFGRTFWPSHCGLPMVKVEIRIESKCCSEHKHYNVGPVAEFVCVCPTCTYMETENFMW